MPKFLIESDLTVVMRRTWTIEAANVDEARAKFEEDSCLATFLEEHPIKVVGDETIVEVVPA